MILRRLPAQILAPLPSRRFASSDCACQRVSPLHRPAPVAAGSPPLRSGRIRLCSTLRGVVTHLHSPPKNGPRTSVRRPNSPELSADRVRPTKSHPSAPASSPCPRRFRQSFQPLAPAAPRGATTAKIRCRRSCRPMECGGSTPPFQKYRASQPLHGRSPATHETPSPVAAGSPPLLSGRI
jgi:hypothetical protein